VAKAGEFVNRKEIYLPVLDKDKIQFVEMDDLGEKAYAEKRKSTKSCFYTRANIARNIHGPLPATGKVRSSVAPQPIIQS
jgi:hypothetical protein